MTLSTETTQKGGVGADARMGWRPGLRAGGIVALVVAAGLAAAVTWPWPGGVPSVTVQRSPVGAEAIGAEAHDLAERIGATVEVSHLLVGETGPRIGTLSEAVTPEGARILLDWAPATEPPLLMREVHAEEELRLVEVMAKHLPEAATVLATPETSARLRHFTRAQWPLAAAAPLVLTPGADAAAAAALADFAGAGGANDDAAAFLDALLSEDAGGAARLRVLTGVGEAYVLVHLHDAFALGLIREGALPMTRRSFTATAFSHDLAREAKVEVAQAGYAAYAIDRGPEGTLRGHFLTSSPDTATLIAQLLPFDTSRLGEVPGMVLVYQTGGYWLYRIAPLAE